MSWNSWLLDHEEKLWKNSLHCKAIYEHKSLSSLMEHQGLNFQWSFDILYKFFFPIQTDLKPEEGLEGCPESPGTLGDPRAGSQGHQRKVRRRFTAFGGGWEGTRWVLRGSLSPDCSGPQQRKIKHFDKGPSLKEYREENQIAIKPSKYKLPQQEEEGVNLPWDNKSDSGTTGFYYWT